MQIVAFLLCAAVLAVVDAQFQSFLSIGDWGGNDLSARYSANVAAVSAQMISTINSANPAFVINTGDNIYWCGVTGVQDAQFQKDFVAPFASQMTLKWYSVLGNHDYAYSPQAQVDYSSVNSQWVMPARYYTKRKLVDSASGTYASFIFLDTSPCVKEYRDNDQSKWDPCGTTMPTCSFTDTGDDFEGACNMHAEVLKQSCSTQYKWFQQKLAAAPPKDWLIVVGHHPIDEVNVQPFTKALLARGFSIYFNGHTHTLTQYTINGKGAYVTSGAGSMVDSPDQHSAASLRKLSEEEDAVEAEPAAEAHWTTRMLSYWYPYRYGGYSGGSGGSSTGTSSTAKVTRVWNQKIAGFTLSTFSADFQSLTTQFISSSGQVMHTFVSTKKGALKNSAAYSAPYNAFLGAQESVHRALTSMWSLRGSAEDEAAMVEAFLA